MYEVSFRLVVYVDDNNSTSFNPLLNVQYIVSNVINTVANYSGTFSLSTPSQTTSSSSSSSNSVTINNGQSISFTLNPTEQQQLVSIIKNGNYVYETYNATSDKYVFDNSYLVSVT
ncbi:hypothetical protein IKS57_04065 [bacterium]|nr:hypothetical protein [bacterium]